MDFSHFSNNDLCSNFQGTFFILVSCWKQKISSIEPYSADLRPTEAFLKTPGFALSEGSEPKRSLKKVLDNLVNDFLVLQAEKCISKTVEMTDQSKLVLNKNGKKVHTLSFHSFQSQHEKR